MYPPLNFVALKYWLLQYLSFFFASAIASVAVTGAARTHLMKLGDQLQAPQSSSGFKNCTHCQGTVQNI